MKKACLIILLIPFLYSCGIFSPDDLKHDYADYEQFFPLKVGNWWQYGQVQADTVHYTRKIEVTGTRRINGREYYTVHDSWFEGDIYYRYFKGKLIQLYIVHNTDRAFEVDGAYYRETLFVDFAADIGEEFRYQFLDLTYNSMITQKENSEIMVYFGVSYATDSDWQYSFRRGLGIEFYSGGWGGTSHLIEWRVQE